MPRAIKYRVDTELRPLHSARKAHVSPRWDSLPAAAKSPLLSAARQSVREELEGDRHSCTALGAEASETQGCQLCRYLA